MLYGLDDELDPELVGVLQPVELAALAPLLLQVVAPATGLYRLLLPGSLIKAANWSMRVLPTLSLLVTITG
jgi:hypothetical protein